MLNIVRTSWSLLLAAIIALSFFAFSPEYCPEYVPGAPRMAGKVINNLNVAALSVCCSTVEIVKAVILSKFERVLSVIVILINMLFYVFLSLLEFVTTTPLARGKDGPVVDLGYSEYQGTSLGSGVNQFLGMRFASSPTGVFRFRAPIDPLATSGIQNADKFGPVCLRTGGNSELESEDCLYINVWSPTNATIASKLPVWVYIQGGGYSANSNPNYNGTTVVTKSGQNIVFVNFNYRVGSWGFLASENVRKDGNLNVGLLDQRMALKWVQKHISQFGGDPHHVVIHGASAGAGSVALHLTAYGGRNDNLFAGAIGQSVFFPSLGRLPHIEWQYQKFVENAGCGGSYNTMACLRSQSTYVLQAANTAGPFPGKNGTPLFYWTPTIDGDLIQELPYKLFEQGEFVKVPLVIGGDTDEGSYFAVNAAGPGDISSFFENNFPGLTTADKDAINSEYPLMERLPMHNAYFPSASAAYGESTFTCPGNYISERYSAASGSKSVWNYRYNVLQTSNVENGLGVPHTFESPAIFGLGNANDDISSSYSTYNAGIIPVMMNYFISFVRDLDPNTYKYAEAPNWNNFATAKIGDNRLVLETNATRMEEISRAQNSRCQFWKGLATQMSQ